MATLLLADDSVTIQRVIEMTFAGEDITVVPVSDGEQAIARISEERPDIVLADIAMPKRSGYDVAAFVKSRPDLAHIPVLLLAGAFEPVDPVRAEQVRCDGVLVKPFEPQQVIARVRELLGGARGTPSQAASGVPRPVERLTSLKLVEPRRERPVLPAAAPAAPPPSSAAPAPSPSQAMAQARPPQPVSPVAQPPAPPPVHEAVREAAVDTPAIAIDEALDDYFDRLDEAFAHLSPAAQAHSPAPSSTPQPAPVTPPTAPTPEEVEEARPVPTIDALLGLDDNPPQAALAPPWAAMPPAPILPVAPPVIEPPDSSPTIAPQPAPPPSSSSSRVAESRIAIADAFSALFAAERDEPVAASLTPPAAGEPQVSEALVEEVTRRVLQRLAPDVVREVVVDVVADVAERLIRDEIARIRQK